MIKSDKVVLTLIDGMVASEGKLVCPHGYMSYVDHDGKVRAGTRTKLSALAGVYLAQEQDTNLAFVTGTLHGDSQKSVSGLMAELAVAAGFPRSRIALWPKAKHTASEVAAFVQIAQSSNLEIVAVGAEAHLEVIRRLYRRRGMVPTMVSYEGVIAGHGTNEQKALMEKMRGSVHELSMRVYQGLVNLVLFVDSDYRLLGPWADATRNGTRLSFYPFPFLARFILSVDADLS